MRIIRNLLFIDVFSLNFDPVKEILKIQCEIYILMKKVVILRKIKVTMKSFAPSFSNRISLSLNRNKMCGNESHEKETKHIHASAADLLHIRIGNFYSCKCGHCKNEVRHKDCLCCREVDAMLIASVKILDREGSIFQSSFYGHGVLLLLTPSLWSLSPTWANCHPHCSSIHKSLRRCRPWHLKR